MCAIRVFEHVSSFVLALRDGGTGIADNTTLPPSYIVLSIENPHYFMLYLSLILLRIRNEIIVQSN